MKFFDQPILNSPYEYPRKHWELDESNRPTQSINNNRRPSSLITPVPRAQKSQVKSNDNNIQMDMVLDTGDDLSSAGQEYNISGHINEIRELVQQWRSLPNERDWQVNPETAQMTDFFKGFCNVMDFDRFSLDLNLFMIDKRKNFFITQI